MSSLFIAQKYCLRVLFGDREAYLDKFKTCARIRTIEDQKLDSKFFKKEHTKPLFKEHGILAVQNLLTYHSYLELFKIIKFRLPTSLLEGYTFSVRKPTLIISQANPPDNNNTRCTKIWNIITPKIKISDFSMSVACIRSKLKCSLLANQHHHAVFDWTEKDFDCANLQFEKSIPTGSTQ